MGEVGGETDKVTKSSPTQNGFMINDTRGDAMNGRMFLLVMASVLALLMLIASLCLPFLHSNFALDMPTWLPRRITGKIQEWAIEKGEITTGSQYLLGIIKALFESQEFFLGWTILIFSLALPAIKVMLLLLISLTQQRINYGVRKRIFELMQTMSHWAMTDVFIVSLCIVIFKAEGFHFRITAGAGLYFYAASGCCSALSIYIVGSIIKRESLAD
jgi:hypothetical protein